MVPKIIMASYFEWVRTGDVAKMIADQVTYEGLQGKSANCFREILVRLYSFRDIFFSYVISNPQSITQLANERKPNFSN